MGKFQKCHLIILTNTQLPSEKISFIKTVAATVDVVTDPDTVALHAETATADAIVIIEDSEKDSGIVKILRENPKVDKVPILSFKSIEEATKIIPLFLESKKI